MTGESHAEPRGRRRSWLGLLLPAILAFAVLIGLGVWQLQRKAWKENLIATLTERLAAARPSILHPLAMEAIDIKGQTTLARAINEVSLLRQTSQAAKMRISIDGAVRLSELIADGVLVSTPAGSTAYNLSVNGPIVPLGAPLMALTPISAFRPRRWRGALLPDAARVVIEILEADKRPVAATADHFEIRRVARVEVATDHDTTLVLLHDPGHSLDERILREQFGV